MLKNPGVSNLHVPHLELTDKPRPIKTVDVVYSTKRFWFVYMMENSNILQKQVS